MVRRELRNYVISSYNNNKLLSVKTRQNVSHVTNKKEASSILFHCVVFPMSIHNIILWICELVHSILYTMRAYDLIFLCVLFLFGGVGLNPH
jgi:hypothetical protein